MKSLCVFFLVVFFNSYALGVNLFVQTGDYSGGYQLVALFGGGTNTSSLAGDQSLDVVPGRYRVIVAGFDNFEVEVDAGGNIAVDNGVSATGANGVMTFNTGQVSLLASDYTGQWFMPQILSGAQVGDVSNIYLVTGLNYSVQIAGLDSFEFSLDSQNLVSSVSKPSAVNVVGNQLIFQTVGVDIDPGFFTGNWSVPNIFNLISGVVEDVRLVRDHEYAVQLDSLDYFTIKVQADGSIVVNNGVSGVVNGNVLTFNTFSMDVDSGAYLGQWQLSNVTPFANGPQDNIYLVPGISYLLLLDNGESSQIHMDSPCTVDPHSIQFSNSIFTFACSPIVQDFLCEQQTEYLPRKKCRGVFEAKNQEDLEHYLSNFGLRRNKYQHLKISFDLVGENVSIHSPCVIKVSRKTKISAKNLCIDGRRGVRLGKQSELLSNQELVLKSGRNIRVGHRVKLSSNAIELLADKKVRIQKGSRLEADEEISANGNSCNIHPFSEILSPLIVGSCFE